jgi:hypothetical protein
LCTRQAELRSAGDPAAAKQNGDVCKRLADLGKAAGEKFPLSPAECDALLASLQHRVLALYDAEVAALAALSKSMN